MSSFPNIILYHDEQPIEDGDIYYSSDESIEEHDVALFDRETDEMRNQAYAYLNACRFDYHVVYSHTFQVPMLYFNPYNADGKLFSLKEVWDSLPEEYLKDDVNWTVITQMEHPYRGTPFYGIHPCDTPQLMVQVAGGSSNKLLSWLSLYAPLVRLAVPIHVFKDLMTKNF
eukprot:TRINITY_DN5852_c0_g1_i1.p1 TRINITY_DN5852_c0_g1~~TRINITY_DN5852_c0_g1_i1.p1  ORF type:complete len:171 (-),score=32.68 TRINITY_DN5852_c0_g1_i1:12-524(-)